MSSRAWDEYLENLREMTSLLRSDPGGQSWSDRHGLDRYDDPQLTRALVRASGLLSVGRLQGCVEAQVQEFLELIEERCETFGDVPRALRANLARKFISENDLKKSEPYAELVESYASLFEDPAPLLAGTLKTDSFTDGSSNPWPDVVQGVLKLCGLDAYKRIKEIHSKSYLAEQKHYVEELIRFRNAIAHGSDPAPWTHSDLRLRLRWSIRFARDIDRIVEEGLVTITGEGWRNGSTPPTEE